jgi:phage tail-like protein
LDDERFRRESVFGATFIVEVDSHEVGRFTEVSGLAAELEFEEVTEGGENGFVHKLPGRIKWPNIVLKQGITEQGTLLDWLNQASGDGFAAARNQLDRTTVAITMVGQQGTLLRAYNLRGAYPVKWTGPTFSASATEMPSEELEIAHHGLEVEHL